MAACFASTRRASVKLVGLAVVAAVDRSVVHVPGAPVAAADMRAVAGIAVVLLAVVAASVPDRVVLLAAASVVLPVAVAVASGVHLAAVTALAVRRAEIAVAVVAAAAGIATRIAVAKGHPTIARRSVVAASTTATIGRSRVRTNVMPIE